MIERPVVHGRFRIHDLGGGGILFRSERESIRVGGRLYAQVCSLLDGTRTAERIADDLSTETPAAEVFYALMQLERLGLLTDGEVTPEAVEDGAHGLAHPWFPEALAARAGTGGAQTEQPLRAEVRGVPAWVRPTMVETLEACGVIHASGAEFTIVVVDDYLRSELRAINRDMLSLGRRWMLAKPVGTQLCVGPWFVPRVTACWACLAHRLRHNRPVHARLERLFGQPPEPPPMRDDERGHRIAAEFVTAHSRVFRESVADGSAATLLSLDLEEGVLTLHEVQRRVQCRECGDPGLVERQVLAPIELSHRPAGYREDGGYRPLAPEVFLDRHGHLVDPLTGIVPGLSRVSAVDDAAQVYTAGECAPSALQRWSHGDYRAATASAGKGMQDAQARASAFGEAVERYCGVSQGDEPVIVATGRDLGEAAIHPNLCMLFSAAQYESRSRTDSGAATVPPPFDWDKALEWSPVWSLTKGGFRYLPTSFLYYGRTRDPETTPCWPDSNGCAAGQSLEDAILQGLLELIERDAAAVWWYNRLPRPALRLIEAGAEVERMRAMYREQGRDLWVLDLTHDLGIPTFTAVTRRTGQGTDRIKVGFGTHFDPSLAARRSVSEVHQLVASDRQRERREASVEDRAPWFDDASLDDHPYLAPASHDAVHLPDTALAPADDIAHDVQQLIRILQARGLEVFVLDQTRPDIGIPVVKVIVPGLRHSWQRLAPGRLYDVPLQMGWLDARLDEADLNPVAFRL